MLIKNGTICDKDCFEKKDVYIENGKIKLIGDNLNIDTKNVIDGTDLILMPSFIDLNVRVKNDTLNVNSIKNVCKEALKGGVCSISLMPDCEPSIDSESVLEFIHAQTKYSQIVNLYPKINATDKDGKLSNISILLKHHAKGIFLNSNNSGNIIRRVFEYALMRKERVFCSFEDKSISSNGVMNDSLIASKLGLPTISDIGEISEVAKIIEFGMFIKAPIYFSQIATKRSIDLISNAKKDGLDCFCEVSIHHLALNDELCDDFNTTAKIKPPLKDEFMRATLIEALKDGKIDTITSLQSSKSITHKDLSFEEAAFGLDEIGEFFAICYTYLVENSILTLQNLSKLCSYNPSIALNLTNKGVIKEGFDADLILVDLNSSKKIENSWSMYNNQTLKSKIVKHIVNGEVLYSVD
ncbi:MAG: amidohydrolase family protein [Campylobacterales bacterium]|nr:amidohydrolase family protein [Campylobacterales bacterium]